MYFGYKNEMLEFNLGDKYTLKKFKMAEDLKTGTLMAKAMPNVRYVKRTFL